jgi:serine protease AprX
VSPERDAIHRIRRQILRARARRVGLVLAALMMAGLLLFTAATAGIIRLPLEGTPLTGDVEWVLTITQAERLRTMGYDGSGVTICLVDSGIDPIHPDLASVPIVAWKDLINGEPMPYDDGGHGTAMAGLMVARGRLQGVAPGASLMVVKALRSNGTASSETVASGIRFCMDPDGDGDPRDGADIISLSLGAQRTPFTTDAAAKAATRAAETGILVVSSAGNDGREDDGDVGTPASEPLVIAVGSLNHRLEVAAFSSKGNNSPEVRPARVDPHRKPEFVLPGVGLVTTGRGSSYASITGTSASAALLSGMLALMLQAHPEYRKAGVEGVVAVKEALMRTALRLKGQQVPHDDYYGYGLPQVYETHLLLELASRQ